MKTSLPTFLCSLALALGFTSCVPIDPYYDGGGYQSGGGYGGGSYGGGYNNGYAPRPSYDRPYYGGGSGGYSSGYDRYRQPYNSYDRDHHHDHDYDRDHGRSSSSNKKKDSNDTLYKYRGKNGPSGNHTIDWWHDRGYQRSQLDFAD